MSTAVIHQRYAQALLEIGLEKKNFEQLGRELDRVSKLFANSDELAELMRNPSFNVDSRKAVLGELLKRVMVSPITRNFLFLLTDRNRIRHLPEITRAYHDLTDSMSGRQRARVTVATPLSDADQSRLKSALQKITNQQIVLEIKEDPSILGGIITHVGGKVYDGSVRTQLENMKQRIREASL
ncbi:MAG: ATP synthase F1 subunit delta [Bradymonadia bacterium]